MTQRALRSSEVNLCRCCQQADQPEKMLTPCDCKGNLQQIHLTCLQQQIKNRFKSSKIKQRKMMKERLQCQTCKSQMKNLQIRMTNRCVNFDQFSEKLQKQDIFFMTILLLLYIGFHLVGVILVIRESAITKTVGGIWLFLVIVAFNTVLIKIIGEVLFVREATAYLIDFP